MDSVNTVTAGEWSLIDLMLLVGLGLSTVVGIWRGLIKEVMALLGWAVAYFMAQWFGPQAGLWVPVGTPGSQMNAAAGMVVVFVASWLGWAVLTWAVTQVIKESGLGGADRFFGAVFGLMRGVLVALVLVTIVRATPLAQWEPWLASTGVHWLEILLEGLRPVLPEQVIEFLPAQS
jgi:membrane protein required for colicin V production